MTTIDPIILFFILGVMAGVARAELRLPSQIYDFVSMLLLLSIGLKGGIELAKQPALTLLPQMFYIILMGVILPIIAFPVLHWLLAGIIRGWGCDISHSGGQCFLYRRTSGNAYFIT